MAAKLTNANLLQISKSNATTITNFRLGVHLSSTSGRSIDELTEAACRDRLAFARRTLSYARTTMRGAKPQYRVALARSYYAMYHAARAVVYFIKRGDDHEAHSELPKYIPTDFPNRDQWENELKAARFERNRADYDPYPKSDRAFRTSAESALRSAESFLPVAKRYLVKKGCNI